MTDLKPEIDLAIEREVIEFREAIADRTEAAPVVEILVKVAKTYTATRDPIREYATSKGYNVSNQNNVDKKHYMGGYKQMR